MIPRTRVSALAALLLAALCACATLRVNSDYDPDFDFSGFRSWGWLTGPQAGTVDPRLVSGLVGERIRSALEKHLTARGYQRSASGKPDFLVGYHAAVEDKVDVRTINRASGYGPGWGAGRGLMTTDTYVREYEQGTLILDIVDPRSNRLVWRGSAQAEVNSYGTPEQRAARIDDAVGQILEGFPPR